MNPRALSIWGFILCGLFVVSCSKTTVEGEHGKSLTLVEPANQTLRLGKTNEIAITITRSKWDGPVDVRFSNLPSGVTVTNEGAIEKGKYGKNFVLEASGDAALVSGHVATVTASAEGMKVSEQFKISVTN